MNGERLKANGKGLEMFPFRLSPFALRQATEVVQIG
jgi:hypothetical protein